MGRLYQGLIDIINAATQTCRDRDSILFLLQYNGT